LVHRIPGSGLLMDFIGALVVGTLGEIAATWEREPSPVFVVPAIVVYVPGELAYQSMVSFLRGHFPAGLQSGLTALLAAGAISLGLALSAAFIRPLLRRGT
ncbi:MAG: threonine/serine exporter family protein, partial [Sulfobacillus sp.]|nr:threonine/serine exporter family protein [Sulfobacillus sp.]